MSYSRLASQEKKRILRQAAFFFAGGIGVILIFIFALIPIFSKILTLTNKALVPSSTPPPIVMPPSLTQPFEATNSAQISIKGTALPNTTVILGENGSLDRKTTATASGQFEFRNVSLSKGNNLFQAYDEDANGNRSDGSPQMTIAYATDAPKLDISDPADGATITERKQQVITVKGKTDSSNKVYINDQFVFVGGDGSFTGRFQLQQGDNLLHIRAVNSAGNETSKDLTLHYTP